MDEFMFFVVVVTQLLVCTIFGLSVVAGSRREDAIYHKKRADKYFEETRELRYELFATKLELAQITKQQAVRVYSRTWNSDKRGYVYIIHDTEFTGYYKIGRTRNTVKRFGDFSAKWPFEWELIHIIETDDCVALETYLHGQYADRRTRGEWFALDDDDIAAIRRLA